MGVTVGVNMLSVVHKDSGGVSIAFPDVCKTPTPGGPVPIPYPNISKASDTDKGTKKVLCDGNSTCVKDSNFKTSVGDEGGCAGGGVVSGKQKGISEFVLYSMDVKFEGKNVPRAFDIMLHNNKNTPPMPVMQGPIIVIPSPVTVDEYCAVCREKI
ncbi:Uncharacterised protein [BD1-7 clade bacterium]|uniref:Uncharacterized protein n=1 Tax=BD1-7 clade bacterium TaxID=2029982 RepID=A0A5S9QLT0_9GAMM|nr:Uncharacterised protein [BD1-7 clade bacterium]CAA0096941.1 Uncharacterised protein [BD1-7 clade bacterium]CAA0109536.1 Uncharacterised protein [BD1-7 clade bacterium]CAA0116242.1 Uncharacterised protein [BD1-7 clade bacterium]CAA0119913.1 Uncharacterised protein [BD1-7 clade bacterium]